MPAHPDADSYGHNGQNGDLIPIDVPTSSIANSITDTDTDTATTTAHSEKSPVNNVGEHDESSIADRLDSGDSKVPTNDYEEVEVKRLLIQELIRSSNTGKEGDLWYLISTEYLDKFLNLQVESFQELKTKLGPFDCSSIVDSNGNLYPENEEPIGTYNLSPAIFSWFSKWFGISGNPVTRCLIINEETGTKEVERYPPVFFIHQLGKKSSTTVSSHSHRHGSAAQAISVSRTKTFNDLFDEIRIRILNVPKTASSVSDFRVWFIDSKNIADYNQNIPITSFIYDIPNKSLVHHDLLDLTLKSQGVESSNFHLLVETIDKRTHSSSSSKIFPIDVFLGQIDLTQYDFDAISSKGGHLGLNNLGNTCYMNSALQCLVHVPEINHYFFHNMYKRELNLDNPLGNKGDVANSFGGLLKSIFESPSKSSGSSSSTSIAPREFKSTIGRYSSMFSGYLQQDSQEFLSWLLDAIHEDLNRIQKKPYCEKPELKDEEINDPEALVRLAETCWSQHKLRNDSVIIDLFTGMYQSTLVCPVCSKTSITFDPFNDMTLPLPVSKMWYHTFTIIDLSDDGNISNRVDNDGQRILKLEVELNKRSNYDDLLKYLAKFLGVPTGHFFLYEVHQNTFYSDFQLDYNKNKFLPIGDIIRDADDILVYYIPHDPSTDLIVPVLNSVEDPDRSYNITELFGIPLFVVFDKEVDLSSFGIIRKKLEEKVKILSKANILGEYEKIKKGAAGYSEKKIYSVNDFPALSSNYDLVKINKKTESINNFEELDTSSNTLGVSQSSEYLGGIDFDDQSAASSTLNNIKTENIAVDSPESDGYDSDISLANPFVSANLGFTIKFKTGDSANSKSYGGFRGRFNFNQRYAKVERTINAPLNKPNLNDFKPLADELPKLKRSYYHYSEYERNLDQEMEDLADEVDKDLAAANLEESEETERDLDAESDNISDSTSKTNEADGFVLVDHKNQNAGVVENNLVSSEESGRLDSQLSSSDEDTESEPQLAGLFDGVSNPGLSLPPPPPPTYSESIKPSTANSPIDSPGEISSPTNNHPLLISKDTILLCDWDPQVYHQFFEDDSLQSWSNLSYVPNPELEQNKAKFEKQRNSKISLYDCLKSFSTPEVLGDQDLWYCPRCKDHRQATKTIQLWSTGDILTIHLKRFHSARAFSDKIDIVVDFPIEGLQMSDYVSNPASKNDIYDLIAVDNHYGGLGGGHYTASAKNFKDNKWYYFNDSRVTPIEDPKETITGAAYLLFYRKRTSSSDEYLGGENLNNILHNGRETYKKSLSNRRNLLEQVYDQIEVYDKYEDAEKEKIKGKEGSEEKDSEEYDDDDNDEDEDDSSKSSTPSDNSLKNRHLVPATRPTPAKSEAKKSRPFDNVNGNSKISRAQFAFDEDDNDIDYDDEDLDNTRKQRLISKEKNNSKLIQIKSNGKQEISSSPVPVDLSSGNDEL